MNNDEWIDYLNSNEEPPTEGFVEIIDTFFGETRRHFMDMSIETQDRILWNRAAPRCVSKYRFVPETKYLEVKVQSLISQIEQQKLQLMNTEFNLKVAQDRLNELKNG